MSWWPHPWYWQPRYPYPPTSPEEELKGLEEYKRQLEEEIKWVEEEIKRVEEEMEKMRKELEKPEAQQPYPQPAYPMQYPPAPPAFPPTYGYGYGYGWGRRRGMGGGFGRGMGAGMMPAPAAMPQQAPIPPPQAGVKRVAASVEENNGLNSRISPRFGRCPFLAFVDIAGGEVKSLNIIPNQAAGMPMGAGMAVAQLVVSSGASEVIGANFGPNVSMAFQQAGLKVDLIEPFTPLGEALKKLGLVR